MPRSIGGYGETAAIELGKVLPFRTRKASVLLITDTSNHSSTTAIHNARVCKASYRLVNPLAVL